MGAELGESNEVYGIYKNGGFVVMWAGESRDHRDFVVILHLSA